MLSPLRGGLGPLGLASGVAAPWWYVAGQTCVAAYKAIGAVDLATSYINLANPGTYNAAPGIAPTLGAGGWVFDGSNKWLNTGYVASKRTSTIIVRFSDAKLTLSNLGVMGSSGPSVWPVHAISMRRDNLDQMTWWAGGGVNVPGAMIAGVAAIAGTQAYRNGVADGAAIADAGGEQTNTMILGGISGAIGWRFSGTIVAAAIYSTTLSAGEMATQSAKMAAL